MKTLRQFSEKERNDHIYQARQNVLRQQMTIQKEMEAAVREKAAALQEKDAAQQREAAALAEIERLKALLRD